MQAADLLIPIIESISDNVSSHSARRKIFTDIVDSCIDFGVDDLIECEEIDEEFDRIVKENS